MKKICWVLLALLLMGGCSAPAAQTTTTVTETITAAHETTVAAAEDWGVTMRLEKEKPTGVELILDRSGSDRTDEIMCGSDYVLEQLVDGTWKAVPQKDPDMMVAWTAEAYTIPAGGEHRFTYDWDWLYGSLPAGEYRVGKNIMLFRGTGDYDNQMLYAEFAVIE